MNKRGATYGRILALWFVTLWCNTVCAQQTDTLRAKAVKAERLVGDSVTVTKRGNVVTREERLDTAVVDSLLKMGGGLKKNRKGQFKPDPIRSMWLGLVFPGAGQIYNRKLWKLPIVYGGFLGCAYALTWNNQMLRDYSQAYLDIMDDDPNTKSYEGMLPMGYDISGKEERFQTIFKNKKDHFRKYRDLSIFAFAGVYLISVIDAFVDAELSTFDISPDLSLRFEPAVINTSIPALNQKGQKAYGLSCNLNF